MKLLLIVIFHYSLVKAAVNALQLCILCKDCLFGIDRGGMLPKKCLHFFIFQLSKVERRPLRTFQLQKVDFPKLR
jgi:hypothetical protein